MPLNWRGSPRRGVGIGLVALGLWVMLWAWFGREAMLDDALIHLRYAENLRSTWMFTYDGMTPTYGTSSPFFVALLAAFSPFNVGPTLPKVASNVFLLVLLTVVTWKTVSVRTGPWLVFLLVLLSPMSFRWLADGMETSLTVLLAVVIASEGGGARATDRPWVVDSLIWFSVGLLAVLTRIELGLGIAALVLAAVVLQERVEFRRARLPLALGGVAAYTLLVAFLGHVVPDTAVAKAFGPTSIIEAALVVLFSTATALSFGVGLLMLWCASLIALLGWRDVRLRLATLIVNSMVPCLVGLVALRGQAIQGVRHVLWAYSLSITWNLVTLARIGNGELARPHAARSRRWRMGVFGFAAVLMIAWAIEAVITARILGSRREVFREMRDARLERFAGLKGGAYDVGFAGYFSGARMLDFSGLVSGREVATMPGAERQKWVAAQRPDFLFLTAEQARETSGTLSLTEYGVLAVFRSRKLRGEERHALAVSEGAATALGLGETKWGQTLAEFVTR